VAAAMPLTVSITVDHLLRSIKTTNIVPFGYQSLGKLLLDRPVAEDLKPYDFTFFIENTLFWVIAGYLLKLCYDLYWRDKDYGKKLLIALPLLYFPALEAMQLIILNRITDINDVLAGYIGTAIGIAVYNATAEYRRQARNEVQWLFIPLMCYLIYILFSGFRPFDWSLESRVIEMDLLPENLIPFYAYFRVTGLSNLFDLLASLFFFLPVGLYWAYQRMAAGHDYAGTFLRTTLAGLAVGTVIELTQLFSFSRVAEVTDILAYGVGGWLGTFILYYFEKQIRPVLDAHPTSRQAPCATAPTHPDRPPR
ncbi:MAG TPA: VanZ family protein, partial [Calditrichia bacterium]|nr:VanZ family protein [Calditrichia bacterium]